MPREHSYQVRVTWTGNRGTGTSAYRAYGRDHDVTAGSLPPIAASSDAAFRGDPRRWNPELELVAALAQCHMLAYLHLCASAGVIVTAYADDAHGTMLETAGGGQFTGAVLRPRVTVAGPAMIAEALRLHDDAHAACFIASSVSFPVRHEPEVTAGPLPVALRHSRPAGTASPGDAPPGQIIFLNGTSSSGKSSIAGELLGTLSRPFFQMSVDSVNAMRARQRTTELPGAQLAAVLRRTRAGFHRAVAGMARAGNDVVVDYVLSERWRLLDCLTVLDGLDVILVGVHCAPGELRRRGLARGDREPGRAAAQLPLVHAHGSYDMECDTTGASPRACAEMITAALPRLPVPRAFDRLRAELPAGPR